MSQAAYNKKVQVSDDDGSTFYDLPATSPSMDIGGDLLDDTELATNAGYRSRIQGLLDWSASVDSNLKPLTGSTGTDDDSGATAIDIVRTAKLNGTGLKFRYLPTGSESDGTGLEADCMVETFNHAGDVGGLETISISLQGNGAISVLSN